ncbi:hypothetical protein PCL_05358 [Purpureocillium lilacinum]|uniref:Uncharacterized protein n=1 Tax=Purpureocillium lilacinum TaxID=33203 RepID=A0A2U3DV60_PURLI|nr:hypothetical protein PCL_05358 [Purpureocillium lilacinum]
MALVNASATAAREDFGPSRSQKGTLRGTRDGRRHERAARLKADRAACHWPTGGRKPETDRAQWARARGPRPLWFGGDLGALASGGRRGRAWMVVDEVLAAGHHWKRQGGHLAARALDAGGGMERDWDTTCQRGYLKDGWELMRREDESSSSPPQRPLPLPSHLDLCGPLPPSSRFLFARPGHFTYITRTSSRPSSLSSLPSVLLRLDFLVLRRVCLLVSPSVPLANESVPFALRCPPAGARAATVHRRRRRCRRRG